MTDGARSVDACREVLRQHAKSFRWAAAFLPADRRDDAAVVYALCRLIDDLADEAPSHAIARRDLDALEAELRGERPPRPVVALFDDVVERRQIERAAVFELMRGVRDDLERVRLRDDRALLRYSYRVAGTVGVMMCGVLGVRDPDALPHAIDLGVAMQLTNISRDVAEDLERDRVYVPASRLLPMDVEQDVLVADRGCVTATAPVVADLLALAEQYYASGVRGLRYIPARPRLAIAVAALVYRGIGGAIARQSYDPARGRAYVGVGGKLMRTVLAFGIWALSFVRPPGRHPAELHAELDGLPGARPPRALPPPDGAALVA